MKITNEDIRNAMTSAQEARDELFLALVVHSLDQSKRAVCINDAITALKDCADDLGYELVEHGDDIDGGL